MVQSVPAVLASGEFTPGTTRGMVVEVVIASVLCRRFLCEVLFLVIK